MECSEALDLLYESFDAQISPAQQSLLNGHRRTCFACAGTLAKAQRFQDLIRRVPQLTVPRGLEARVVERVLLRSGQTVAHRPKMTLAILSSWRPAWRPAFAAGGVLAAGLAVFLMFHNVFNHGVVTPADQTITASIQGSVQAVGANNRSVEVAEADTSLSSGEVIRPVGSRPAIIAITPHLALTMASGSEIQVSRLHRDLASGAADAVFLVLRRGTLRVNEILHRDVSPVHVATAQATFVPTGTTFSVSVHQDSTDLSVAAGSVQVLMPGRSFSVLSGHQVRITKDTVFRDILLGKHVKVQIR